MAPTRAKDKTKTPVDVPGEDNTARQSPGPAFAAATFFPWAPRRVRHRASPPTSAVQTLLKGWAEAECFKDYDTSAPVLALEPSVGRITTHLKHSRDDNSMWILAWERAVAASGQTAERRCAFVDDSGARCFAANQLGIHPGTQKVGSRQTRHGMFHSDLPSII